MTKKSYHLRFGAIVSTSVTTQMLLRREQQGTPRHLSITHAHEHEPSRTRPLNPMAPTPPFKALVRELIGRLPSAASSQLCLVPSRQHRELWRFAMREPWNSAIILRHAQEGASFGLHSRHVCS